GEEDELLPEGVEAAVVEHDRGHDVRDVPLVTRDVVEDLSVLALEVAERGQPGQSPHEQTPEHRARHGEQPEPHAQTHGRRRPRSFASAASRMNGKAMLETTSSESATSGAWKITNRMTSASPYSPATSVCLSGSRAVTTANPPRPTSAIATAWSGITCASCARHARSRARAQG